MLMIGSSSTGKVIFEWMALALVLAGCGQDGNYVGFADKRQVKIDPDKVLVLGEPDGVRIETEAAASAIDILVQDSLLIFSRYAGEYSLAAVNKNTIEDRGAFIRRGRAPGEVTDLIPLGAVSLERQDGVCRMGYRDATGQWVFVDLFASFAAGNPQILGTEAVPTDFQQVFEKEYLGFGRFLGENLVDRQTRYERSIQGGGLGKEITPAMERLNRASVVSENSGLLFNVLGTVFGYNPEIGRMVEASTILNTIHLYDIEGSFARTLYLGERPEDLDARISEYQQADDLRKLFRATCVRTFPGFFAVMNHDASLNLFNWSGKLLQAVRLEVPAQQFDLDLDGGGLYTLDYQTETVWRFDITSILEKLQ